MYSPPSSSHLEPFNFKDRSKATPQPNTNTNINTNLTDNNNNNINNNTLTSINSPISMNSDDPFFTAPCIPKQPQHQISSPNSALISKLANRRKYSTANSNNDTNDQYSLTSSISQSSYNSKADNSLIFERLVQDPLIDAQPIPHSLPRHVSSETFIPASLDTTTHMIRNNEFDFVIEEPVDFGFSSRRSSLANLEAALGPSSRRPSTANLQSLRANPNNYSTNTLSRSNTNSSFSNLTQQFQNAQFNNNSNNNLVLQSQPLSQSNSQNTTLPPLTTSLTNPSRNPNSVSASPMMKNKSFCSYADIIAQDDHESKFSIRRPSISTSLSSQKLARTNSMNSQLGNASNNSPRSPTNINPTSFANNFRNNSISNISRFRTNSPSIKDLNYNSATTGSAIDFDDTDQSFNNTSKKPSGFSGRSIGGYSMRISNSNASSNIDELLKKTNDLSLKKELNKNISPQCSRQSDEDSIKSFKSASEN
jgi:hypothetical protein